MRAEIMQDNTRGDEKRTLTGRTVLTLFVAAMFVLPWVQAPAAEPGAEGPDCWVETHPLNPWSPFYDGNWQGITVASDGRCYFASSTHAPDRGAGFFRFDPETSRLDVLAEDLTMITGYHPAETVPQGKVHSPIVESDGWLYFATHLANYWPEARNAYPGAHVLGYHLETESFRDFGIVRPGFSIYSAIGVDPVRGQLFVFVVPFADQDVADDGCHLYRIDIESGRMSHLGQVVDRGRRAAFWMFVDHKGDCWFSIWGDGGNLNRVHADSSDIATYTNVLPEARLAGEGGPVSAAQSARRSWTWVTPLPNRKQALFTMGLTGGNDERLWRFDPAAPIETGEAFIPIGEIGATFLSVALGGDRVYFVQYQRLQDARRFMPENMRDRPMAQLDFPAVLHLRSIGIDLASPQQPVVVDHGRLIDRQARLPRMIESLAADAGGNVFLVGSWTTTAPGETTRQYIWEGQRFWPGEQPGTFKTMQRGEFFGHVEIP